VSQNRINVISNLMIVAAGAVLILIAVGGIVRTTGSGLGCPDWPLCYGKVLPPLEYHAIIEYIHRFIASIIVGPLVILNFVLVILWVRSDKPLLWLSVAIVALLFVQGGLGAVTVLNELPPAIVAVHLSIGELFFAMVITQAVLMYRHRMSSPYLIELSKKIRLLTICAVPVMYLVLISGSLVTANGALAACLSWPLCGNNGFLASIHMGHRWIVLILGLFVVYVVHFSIKNRAFPKAVRKIAMLVALVFVIQIIVGAFMVFMRFPVYLTATHVAMASMVWGATVWYAAQLILCRRSN